MSKMTLSEFRDIKNIIIKFVESIDERLGSDSITQQGREASLEELLILQDKYLSADLSEIPFEEWKDFFILSRDGIIDLSKTHANIDFSLLREIDFEKMNLNGCNVRGIHVLNYDENTFNKEFMEEHPEYFPDASLPSHIQSIFYDKRVMFSDIDEYPSLRICVNESSFENGRDNPSCKLINTIGFDYAMRFFNEYPEFVLLITDTDNRFNTNGFFDLRLNKEFNKNASYEDAKMFIYNLIIEKLKQRYAPEFPPLEIIPPDMIEAFPNVFIKNDELPQDIIDKYYGGNLSVSDIRTNMEILKNKELKIGTNSSLGVRSINHVFGDVWNFFEQVPPQLDSIVESYLLKYWHSEEKLDSISKMDVKEIIADSLKYSLQHPTYKNYSLDNLYIFSQYISIKDLFVDYDIYCFFESYGFERLIEFNNENDFILDDLFRYLHFLERLSLYYVRMHDNSEPKKLLEKFVRLMRSSDNFHDVNLLHNTKHLLIKLFPNEFIDLESLGELAQDLDEEIIKKLESGFNGQTNYLFVVLNQYPFLTTVLNNKNIIFKSNSTLLDIYDNLGTERFLNICVKFGMGFVFTIDNLTYQEKMDFVEKLHNDDYEQIVNDFIYKWLTNERKYDIRILPSSFKKDHPELYLPENAPLDLQNIFYGEHLWGNDYLLMTPKLINMHPEWIPYLIDIDLTKSLRNHSVRVDYGLKLEPGDYSPINIYKLLQKSYSNKDILEFLSKYGACITNISVLEFESKEDEQIKGLIETIIERIYRGIKNRHNLVQDINLYPLEFRVKYHDVFLAEDAPQELQNLFYQRKITPEIIQQHPEWINLLEDKSINSFCEQNILSFVLECIRFKFDNKTIFSLFQEFGVYLTRNDVDISNFVNPSIDEIKEEIKKRIISGITRGLSKYDESAKSIFGDTHPELFLDENAPEALKNVFYNKTTPLTFQLLKQNPEWLPYLDEKNVLLSLKKGVFPRESIEMFFSKYGDKEAIRIALKNPESVTRMLKECKHELLFLWYDKYKFIPHHVAMMNFPFEEADKFIVSAKKWSEITKIKTHNLTEEGKEALLKASVCFGVFENDNAGYNKLINLFSGIPKVLNELEMDFIIKAKENTTLRRLTASNNATLKRAVGYLELLEQSYEKKANGNYELIINTQQQKELVVEFRKVLEEIRFPGILTPDKAHKLFGGFEMKYDSDFREFILKNMNAILTSDEYITYVRAMQKQWKQIKVFNSNRTLTLDLALAFVMSMKYELIETGNEMLAEVSKMAGYSQDSFNKLQEIYNYGKARTFSSIPRISKDTDKYHYEILRLDDPLALAIGTLTDCCQELGDAAELCMEHSAVSSDGRVFVIKDKNGNIVAQSWIWRNKNVICFDNIEIPSKAFTRTKNSGMSTDKFADEVYELYKEAAEEIIKLDEEELKKLLVDETITEEQYDALKVSKITVGEGYNDIKESLQKNSLLDDSGVAKPLSFVPPVELSHGMYTSDSDKQYIIAGDKKVKESNYDNPIIYYDDYVIYSDDSMLPKHVLMLQKLEMATYDNEYYGNAFTDETKNIVSSIAYNYDLNPDTTRIIMNANFAIIYDINNSVIRIGDILYNFSVGSDDKANDISNEVIIQIRLALNQISNGNNFDISSLNQEQIDVFNKAMSSEFDIRKGL